MILLRIFSNVVTAVWYVGGGLDDFKCSKAEAIAAVIKKHPEEHRAYLEAANAGRR